MPDTKIQAIEKINGFLLELRTMDDTRTASNLIDEFERECPQERSIIQVQRNYLCDKTFEIFKKKYPVK